MRAINNCIVIALLISFSLFQELSAQSLKKAYKYINNGEISKTELELNQLSAKIESTGKDFTLYSLANCLVVSNENSQSFDPFKSLDKYRLTLQNVVDKADVDKFLKNYDLSIEIIQQRIYQSILNYVKKLDTEKDYQQALDVCQGCEYKDEVLKLKETAAFTETKKNMNIEAYKYFLNNYKDSEYAKEIRELMFEMAFNNATTYNSVDSYKNYIKDYSYQDNKYLPIAIHRRDSLAFSFAKKSNKLYEIEKYIQEYSHDGNKFISNAIAIRDSIAYNSLDNSYMAYKNFIIKYPQSSYTSIVKNKLPDILLEEAENNGSINLLETFISDFPNDTRVELVKGKIEELEFEKVLSNMSHEKIYKFKQKFPNSNYNDSLNFIVSSLSTNNDLKNAGLFGNVKFVQEHDLPVYLENGSLFSRAFDHTPDYYDEFGRIISKLGDNANVFNIYYGRNGKIERIKHIDDDRDSLVTSVDYYFYNHENLLSEIYSDKCDLSIKEYKDLVVKNKNNWDYNTFRPSICYFTYNGKGLLTQKKCVAVPTDLRGNYRGGEYSAYIEVRYKYNSLGKLKEVIGEGIEDSVVFKYDNQGKLIEKHCYSEFDGLQYIEKYNSAGNVYQKDTYMYGKYAFKELFEYNEKGLLVKETVHNQHGIQPPDRTEYIYDSHGNWIKKTKKLSSNNVVYTRTIDYYPDSIYK